LQTHNFSRFGLDRIPCRAKRLRLFFKIGKFGRNRTQVLGMFLNMNEEYAYLLNVKPQLL